MSRTQGRLGECFPFDEQNLLAAVGSADRGTSSDRTSCPRLGIDEGEDNAGYKLTLFSLTHCPGRGACVDPVALSKERRQIETEASKAAGRLH